MTLAEFEECLRDWLTSRCEYESNPHSSSCAKCFTTYYSFTIWVVRADESYYSYRPCSQEYMTSIADQPLMLIRKTINPPYKITPIDEDFVIYLSDSKCFDKLDGLLKSQPSIST